MTKSFIYRKSVNSDDSDQSHVMFWNRRKNIWQSHLTKSCVYPTLKGTSRTADMLFSVWRDMRPHKDYIGRMTLEHFAKSGYENYFL